MGPHMWARFRYCRLARACFPRALKGWGGNTNSPGTAAECNL